jgi:hypothetical protein
MGSLMMPVFKRGQLGTVTHKMIDADRWDYYRGQGWYDADNKVPLNPGQQAEVIQPAPVYNAPVKPYGAFGSVLGETASQPRKIGAQPGNKNAAGKRK